MLSLAESSSFKLSSCCWRRSLCSSNDSRLISNSWLIFWRREERERGRKGTRLDEKTDEKNGKDNRTRNWASWLVLDHETRDLFYILPCLKCLCETNSQCMFSIWKCFLPVFLWYKLKVSKKKRRFKSNSIENPISATMWSHGSVWAWRRATEWGKDTWTVIYT